MKTQMHVWKATLCLAMVMSIAVGANAQQFPHRPLTLIVPVASGGLTDIVARQVAQRLGERIGQSVVVDNRPGGGGILAMKAVAKMPADGHSLIIVFPGSASVSPVLNDPPPYQTLKDFAPVARLVMYPLVLVSRQQGRADLKGILDDARRRPGGMSYGSAGNTTSSHLAMELFKREAKLDILHVPFKGESNALNEVISGRIDLQFPTLGVALPLIRAGKVRAIGVATSQRSKLAADIPTLAEAGLLNLDIPGWYGILAPAGTPPAIVGRLSRELTEMMIEPELEARFEKLGVQLWPAPADQFGSWIRQETDRWQTVIKQAGIKAD